MTARFAVICWFALACVISTAPQVPSQATSSTGLAPVSEIRGDFLLRQQLAFRYAGGQGSFETILQKRCDDLTVIALTPFGTRAFTLIQRGSEIWVQSGSPRTWPFPLRHILEDVHRVLLPPIAEEGTMDGVYERPHGSEQVTEYWTRGRLSRREVRPNAGGSEWKVIIRFEAPPSPDWPPDLVRLRNDRWGYELEITTLSRRKLSCP